MMNAPMDVTVVKILCLIKPKIYPLLSIRENIGLHDIWLAFDIPQGTQSRFHP